MLNVSDCLIREVGYFVSDVFMFSWKFQTVSLPVKEKILNSITPLEGEKKIFKVVK